MAENAKAQEQLWKLFDSLRITVGYYNLFSNAVHLIFLKYLVSYSDKFDFSNISSYKAIASFKRKYDSAKLGEGYLQIADVDELLHELNSEPIFNNLKIQECVFGYDSLLQNLKSQKSVLKVLDEIEIDFSKEFFKEFLELLIQQCTRDVTFTGVSVTNKSLRELVVKILKISKDDVILNCFSGYSTLLLNIDTMSEYIGYELNMYSYNISKMLIIMLGYFGNTTKVFNSDFLVEDTHNIADKVFSDGPLNLKYEVERLKKSNWLKDVKTKDGNLLILYKVLDCIKEGGKAVIAVPGKVLFSANQSYQELRNKYVEAGLKAVVSLPPLWYGVNINTNLIVVEKGYRGRINFIDASKIGILDRSKCYFLDNKEIDKIAKIIDNNENIISFSKSVEPEIVLEENNWLPNLYLGFEETNSKKTIKEIDSELDSLYNELMNNLK